MDGAGDGGSILSVAASIATLDGGARGTADGGRRGRGNGVMEHSVIRYRSINTKYTTAAADDGGEFDRRGVERTNAGSADSLMID